MEQSGEEWSGVSEGVLISKTDINTNCVVPWRAVTGIVCSSIISAENLYFRRQFISILILAGNMSFQHQLLNLLEYAIPVTARAGHYAVRV